MNKHKGLGHAFNTEYEAQLKRYKRKERDRLIVIMTIIVLSGISLYMYLGHLSNNASNSVKTFKTR